MFITANRIFHAIGTVPAHVAQWSLHSGAMCSGAWHAPGAGFNAQSSASPPHTKDYLK